MSPEEPLRTVTGVTNQAEAEMIRNLLAAEGIPAIIQPQNLYVSALQAGGPSNILVSASRYDEARAIVYGSPLEGAPPPPSEPGPDPGLARRVVAGVVLLVVILAVVALLIASAA